MSIAVRNKVKKNDVILTLGILHSNGRIRKQNFNKQKRAYYEKSWESSMKENEGKETFSKKVQWAFLSVDIYTETWRKKIKSHFYLMTSVFSVN